MEGKVIRKMATSTSMMYASRFAVLKGTLLRNELIIFQLFFPSYRRF
jgi:hypothetical protein